MTKHFKNKQEEEEERLEIALQFSKEGSILSLLDFNEATLNATLELQKISSQVFSHFVDRANQAAVNEIVARADNIHLIDILINNAGIAFETSFLNIEDAEWKQIIGIKLTGMFYVAQAVCRQMLYVKRSGSKYGKQKWHGWRIRLCPLQIQ